MAADNTADFDEFEAGDDHLVENLAGLDDELAEQRAAALRDAGDPAARRRHRRHLDRHRRRRP